MLALKPKLYDVPGPGAEGVPALKGGRCACGHAFFPMQRYGCERCGRSGDALRESLLAGRGALVASARVMLHVGKQRQAPFVVVSVKLDDGPVLRTMLAEDTDAVLPVGQRMETRLVEVGKSDAGEPLVDLCFVPSTAAPGAGR